MATNIKQFFDREDVKIKFSQMLGKRAPQFITSVLQIATSNKLLENADPLSIYNSAAIAATLDLPLNNNLGFAWIVPYKKNYREGDEWKSVVLAQFQIGYKGYVQLAQRTGEYQRINVVEVYENQFKSWNPLTEELEAEFNIEGKGEVVGYCCYFKLLNGFEKVTFWKKDKVLEHARKYSKSYSKPKSNASNNTPALVGFSGVWETEFDKMAKKTVLKNTLEKWGILSIEMRKAINVDQAVINDAETEDVTYVDSTSQPIDKEEERLSLMIADATTLEELQKLWENIPDSLNDLYHARVEELKLAISPETNENSNGHDVPEFDPTRAYKKGEKFKYEGNIVEVTSNKQYPGK